MPKYKLGDLVIIRRFYYKKGQRRSYMVKGCITGLKKYIATVETKEGKRFNTEYRNIDSTILSTDEYLRLLKERYP